MKKIVMVLLCFFCVAVCQADSHPSFISSLAGMLSASKKEAKPTQAVSPSLKAPKTHVKSATKKAMNSPSATLSTAKPLTDIKKFPPQTELSKKAMHLRAGMTREEVLKLLGTPTWAQSYKGMPLDWSWRNGQCLPVDVTFNESLRVSGFNQGRATCLEVTYEDVPGDDSLCTNPTVKPLCSLAFKFKSKLLLAQNRNYRSLSTMLPH